MLNTNITGRNRGEVPATPSSGEMKNRPSTSPNCSEGGSELDHKKMDFDG